MGHRQRGAAPCPVAPWFALAAALALAACGASMDPADDDPGAPTGDDGAGAPGATGGGGAPARDAASPPARDGGNDPARDGGSTPPGDGGPPAPLPEIAAPRVAISEVMYHPVLSNADDNDHEFVEIHNPGKDAVALGGWRLAGQVQFTFPAGASIAPGQFLVLARNRAKLLALARYNLAPIAAQVLGDWQGALDDGGGRVQLVDAAGTVVDAVAYDDEFPWPLAADAFGAGQGWFEETQWWPMSDPRRNFAAHRHLGHSLERISYTAPASQVGNWQPSPLDGATPGRPNAAAGTPPGAVEELQVAPEGNPTSAVIRATDRVVVRARVSAGSAITNLEVEWYVEFDRGRKVATPTVTRTPMTPGPDGLQAVLPARAARSAVRYRIVGERRPGVREALAPRPTDPVPYGYHVYFVSPDLPGKIWYDILVSPENWGRLWTNISPNGLVIGCPSGYSTACTMCAENANWNARVPILFAAGGQVFDARGRYNGSAQGRTFGVEIPAAMWPADAPRPSAGPLRALSWSVSFPRYRRFEGMSRITLNRLAQSCPGFQYHVAHFLNEDPRGGRAPAPRVRRWARLFVDGVPMAYVMDVEPVGEDYLKRFHGKGMPIGDVFKIETDGNWGPYGQGSGTPLAANPSCPGIPIKTRYEKSYNRNSNEWRNNDELIALIEGLAAARGQGAARLREFLDKNFDVDATLKYFAVHQWGAPWDDWGKNFNIYKLPPQVRKPGKGAWTVTSWDEDRMFGVLWCGRDNCARAEIPLWCMGNPALPAPHNTIPGCNTWKRVFLETFRAEYDAKMKELNETLFRPENVRKLADDALARYDTAEATQMLAQPQCNARAEAANVKLFAERRYQAVKTLLRY